MKKAYYVYSIFEKLNLTAGFKALAVLLMFSISFLGTSQECSAQGLYTSRPDVDQTFIRSFTFNEDKSNVKPILQEQVEILDAQQPANGLEEVIHSTRHHFITEVVRNTAEVSVTEAVLKAHLSTEIFVQRYTDSFRSLINVEEIVSDYAKLLQ